MNDRLTDENEMPVEIEFSQGTRRIHHIPPAATVLMTASIEKSVWMYFSVKAEQRGIELSELLTEVLKHDIQIHETLEEGAVRDVNVGNHREIARFTKSSAGAQTYQVPDSPNNSQTPLPNTIE